MEVALYWVDGLDLILHTKKASPPQESSKSFNSKCVILLQITLIFVEFFIVAMLIYVANCCPLSLLQD